MSKTIKLTQGKETIVDTEDCNRLSNYKWHYNEKKIDHGYAQRSKYIRISKYKYSCKTIYMHREILNTTKNVDHKNHNTLDNRKLNLRISSQKNNTRNTSRRTNSTSKYLGVHLHRLTGKWRAQIKIDSGKKSLGLHKTEESAAKAYDKAASEYFGEFANLNFK